MVKSVLGKLIQREFGKERYACYADKLKRKQSMDVFCDIYEKLSHSSEEELDLALKGLLDTVQQSIGISLQLYLYCDWFCSYGAYACFFTASCGGVCHNSSDRRTYFFV